MYEKKTLFSMLLSLSLLFALIFSVLSLLPSDLTHFSSFDKVFAFAPSNQKTNNASTIAPANHPPIANAGINQTVNENTTVVLNGIASDPDPDDDTLTYLWNQTAGPPVKLSNNTITNPSFKAPTVASNRDLRFSLTAKDDKSAVSIPAFVVISVKHVNRSPLAIADKDLTVNAGDIVTLDGSRSKDPDNDLLKYAWVQISGPKIKLDNVNSPIATFTALSNISTSTNLIFKLTVTDNKNATGAADTKVTVKYIPPPNQPPISNASTDQTVNAGDTVQLDGSKSVDPDGNITSYSWSQIAGKDVVLNATNIIKPSFTAPSNLSAAIALIFQLTAMDEKNATDISTTKITVKPANRPPVADAGLNQTVSPGDIATLDGTESIDPDGDTLTYSWKQTDGPTVTLNGVDKPVATFTAPTEITSNTTLLFELTVTDNKSASEL